MRATVKNKIKVLHIITRLIIGGAQENTILSVVGLNKKNKYDITLLTGPALGPEGSLVNEAERCTNLVLLPQLRRNFNPVLDLIAFFRLFNFIKKGKFDIVHTHSSKAGILGRTAARLAKVPLIIHTIHGLPFFKGQHLFLNQLYIMLEKFAARFTHKIICVSESLIRDALKARLATKEKFVKIYSGIELDNYKKNQKAKEAIRKKLGIPLGSLVIGKIARLFFFKGHKYILQAAVKIKEKVPDVRFLFIGEGVLKKKLIKQAEDLHLKNNIVFAGLISPDEIPQYIQAIDVLTHVSLHEGLPRAVVQAFALGIPAVCFDVDGARDIVKDNLNGFLVAPKDVNKLARRLLELLEDREKLRQLGTNAQRLAFQYFGSDKMVDAIDNLYEQLLEN